MKFIRNFKPSLCARSVLVLLLLGPMCAAAAPKHPRTVSAANGHFIVNGKPVQMISGSVHYTRIPRPYWRARQVYALHTAAN